MSRIYLKSGIVCGIVLCLFALGACGNPTDNTGGASTPTPIQQEVSGNPTIAPTATATQFHPTTVTTHATPATHAPAGSGPLVILTPTPLPGGSSQSQLVTLPDRTLAIQNVSKQQGMNATTTAVTLVMSVKNTGAKSISNQAGYYLLVGSEGDTFGYQSSATPSYFGTIVPTSTRSGSIVFQVPSAALKGLRLLFRPDITQETVYVALQMS